MIIMKKMITIIVINVDTYSKYDDNNIVNE